LPSSINTVTPAPGLTLPTLQEVSNDTSGLYEFTTVLNQTEYGTTGGSGEVFLDGVKLATNKYTHNSTSVTLTDQPIADKILLVIE
jgi:hypothetical protein